MQTTSETNPNIQNLAKLQMSKLEFVSGFFFIT